MKTQINVASTKCCYGLRKRCKSMNLSEVAIDHESNIPDSTPNVSREQFIARGGPGHSCYFLLRSRRWQFSGNNSPVLDWGELTFGHIIPSSEYIQSGAATRKTHRLGWHHLSSHAFSITFIFFQKNFQFVNYKILRVFFVFDFLILFCVLSLWQKYL